MAKPYVPTEIDRRIIAHLRRLVGDRFKSRYELAIAADVDPSTLSKSFSGERGIGMKLLVKLRDGLKISADWLLDPVPKAELDAAIQPGELIDRAEKAEIAATRKHAASLAGHKKSKKTAG